MSHARNQGLSVAAILCLLGSLGVPDIARAAIYVYQLPDGSRIVTDHALNNKHYRLVRIGETAKGMGHLAASQNSQLFRSDPSAYDRLIRRVAAEHRVDFALVKAVMHVESAFNPYARSHKGALGLMQLMPETAKRYGINDVYDPAQNVEAGVRHLQYLMKMFNDKHYLALAAYNAGEHAVRKHQGVPPYPETQVYVEKVLHYKRHYSRKS